MRRRPVVVVVMVGLLCGGHRCPHVGREDGEEQRNRRRRRRKETRGGGGGPAVAAETMVGWCRSEHLLFLSLRCCSCCFLQLAHSWLNKKRGATTRDNGVLFSCCHDARGHDARPRGRLVKRGSQCVRKPRPESPGQTASRRWRIGLCRSENRCGAPASGR